MIKIVRNKLPINSINIRTDSTSPFTLLRFSFSGFRKKSPLNKSVH